MLVAVADEDDAGDAPGPGRAQAVAVGLFLGMVLAWPMLPTTRFPLEAARQWHDQRVLVGAFEALLREGRSTDAGQGAAGPGYLGLAWALRALERTDAVSALVLLSRLSLYLAFVVLLCSALLRVGRGRVRLDPLALAVAAALGLLTGMSAISPVPWTHFPAVALVLVVVACLRGWRALPRTSAVLLGAAAALLIQTRSFESRVLMLALVAVGLLSILRRRRLPAPATVRAVLPALASGAVVWLLLGRVTGVWTLYSQYADQWTAEDRALSPVSLLTSLPQVFLDPCYHAVCPAARIEEEPLARLAMTGSLWHLPLLHQLAVLPVATAAAWLLVVVALRRRVPVPIDVQVALVVSALTVAGYVANPVMGGAHLANGVVRDFLLPAVAAVWALSRLVVELRRPSRATSGGARAAATAGILAVATTVLVTVLPLPQFPGSVVVGYEVTPRSCSSWPCAVSARITHRDGSISTTTDVIAIQLCDGRPSRVVDGDLVMRIDPDRPLEACTGVTSVGILPRSLGSWMTPQGARQAADHAVRIG